MDHQAGSGNSFTLHTLKEISSYHAHIYFGAGSQETATRLRQMIADRFPVQMGRWHYQPIGPHGQPMYQVAFARELFATFVPWLMLNRQDLSVLVHPNTGHPRQDHEVHALWLGSPVQLDTTGLPDTGSVTPVIEPNTEPNVTDI